jgi:hypothetical protein
MIHLRNNAYLLGQVNSLNGTAKLIFYLSIWFADRVLYRGAGLDLAVYNRAELKQSDHRPSRCI